MRGRIKERRRGKNENNDSESMPTNDLSCRSTCNRAQVKLPVINSRFDYARLTSTCAESQGLLLLSLPPAEVVRSGRRCDTRPLRHRASGDVRDVKCR